MFFLSTVSFFFQRAVHVFFWETCVSCTMLQGRISLTFRCFQSQQSRSWELLKVEKLCASTTWTLLDDTLMYYISYIFFSKFIYNVGSCWFRLQLVFSKLYGTISIIYTYINVNHCNLIVILQVISHIYHISHISHISLIYLLYISYISYRYIIPYSVEDFPERLCSLCQALLKSWSPVMPRDLKAQKLALFSSDFQCHNMF